MGDNLVDWLDCDEAKISGARRWLLGLRLKLSPLLVEIDLLISKTKSLTFRPSFPKPIRKSEGSPEYRQPSKRDGLEIQLSSAKLTVALKLISPRPNFEERLPAFVTNEAIPRSLSARHPN